MAVRASANSSSIAMSSHSPLRRTSVRSGSSTVKAWRWKVSALASIWAESSCGRIDERPLGSPTRAV